MDRRELLAGAGAAALIRLTSTPEPDVRPQSTRFPRKSDFRIADGHTYINAAYTHPMPIASAAAAQRWSDGRASLGLPPVPRPDVKALFAKLINAKPSEICFVPNTSTGENLVLNGLGIARMDGNVVTDELHFDGALVHLMELQKQGLDLRVVKARDYRIDLADLERAVNNNTKLVQVSLVAMYNGFQHDLKAVCDLAHAHGALVYADIVQGVGAVPLDVRATGLDFAACSTFKWLMGDFGLGFLFASERAMERVRRSQWGYHSTNDMTGHFGPFDPESARTPVTWTLRNDATGMFEVGSIGGSVQASVAASLAYIDQLGVVNIQAHRQPLLKKLRDEMPKLGYPVLTPAGSTSPIITFGTKDGAAVQKKFQAANCNIRVSQYWIRFSPSVYNDMRDVDRALEALA